MSDNCQITLMWTFTNLGQISVSAQCNTEHCSSINWTSGKKALAGHQQICIFSGSAYLGVASRSRCHTFFPLAKFIQLQCSVFGQSFDPNRDLCHGLSLPDRPSSLVVVSQSPVTKEHSENSAFIESLCTLVLCTPYSASSQVLLVHSFDFNEELDFIDF